MSAHQLVSLLVVRVGGWEGVLFSFGSTNESSVFPLYSPTPPHQPLPPAILSYSLPSLLIPP